MIIYTYNVNRIFGFEKEGHVFVHMLGINLHLYRLQLYISMLAIALAFSGLCSINSYQVQQLQPYRPPD